MAYVSILKCSDDSYYVGSTTNLELRVAQHQSGEMAGYTASRRPVELVWFVEMPTDDEASIRERQIKGWSRATKKALIRGDWDRIHAIVKKERKQREQRKREGRSRSQ